MPVTETGRCELMTTSQLILDRLMAFGENRLALLAVEAQEARDQMVQTIVMALVAAVCGLLAAMAMTAAIVVAWWAWNPFATLLILAALYALGAAGLYWRIRAGLRRWRLFAGCVDQIRKDRAWLAGFFN